MKKILIAICAVALMASCATSKKTAGNTTLSGEWNITEINGTAVDAADGEDAPFFGFDTAKKRVYGSTGCNHLTGTLNADASKGTIDFSALGMTRMMCPDMDVEQKVTEALPNIKTYKIKGDKLTFCDANGKAVMVLSLRK